MFKKYLGDFTKRQLTGTRFDAKGKSGADEFLGRLKREEVLAAYRAHLESKIGKTIENRGLLPLFE